MNQPVSIITIINMLAWYQFMGWRYSRSKCRRLSSWLSFSTPAQHRSHLVRLVDGPSLVKLLFNRTPSLVLLSPMRRLCPPLLPLLERCLRLLLLRRLRLRLRLRRRWRWWRRLLVQRGLRHAGTTRRGSPYASSPTGHRKILRRHIRHCHFRQGRRVCLCLLFGRRRSCRLALGSFTGSAVSKGWRQVSFLPRLIGLIPKERCHRIRALVTDVPPRITPRLRRATRGRWSVALSLLLRQAFVSMARALPQIPSRWELRLPRRSVRLLLLYKGASERSGVIRRDIFRRCACISRHNYGVRNAFRRSRNTSSYSKCNVLTSIWTVLLFHLFRRSSSGRYVRVSSRMFSTFQAPTVVCSPGAALRRGRGHGRSNDAIAVRVTIVFPTPSAAPHVTLFPVFPFPRTSPRLLLRLLPAVARGSRRRG